MWCGFHGFTNAFMLLVDAAAPGNLATAPYYFSELSRFLNQGWAPLPPQPPPPPPPPPPLVQNVTVELVGSRGRFMNSTAAASKTNSHFVSRLFSEMRPLSAAAACTPPSKLCSKIDLYNHSSYYKGCCCQAGWCVDFVGYWTPVTRKGCGHEGYNGWSVGKEGPVAAFCCTWVAAI